MIFSACAQTQKWAENQAAQIKAAIREIKRQVLLPDSRAGDDAMAAAVAYEASALIRDDLGALRRAPRLTGGPPDLVVATAPARHDLAAGRPAHRPPDRPATRLRLLVIIAGVWALELVATVIEPTVAGKLHKRTTGVLKS